MNAKEAKELLLPIPKEEFIVYTFTDNVGKCCAIGHLVRLKSDNPNDYCEVSDRRNTGKEIVRPFVREKVKEFIKTKHNEDDMDLSDVNNYDDINGYTEDNPKDRVIHLLDDMIAAGF